MAQGKKLADSMPRANTNPIEVAEQVLQFAELIKGLTENKV